MRRFSVLQKIVRSSVVLIFFALGAAGLSSAQDLPFLFIPSPTFGVNQVTTLSSADRMTVAPDFSLIDPDQNPAAAMVAPIPGKTVVLLRRDIKKRGTNNFTWFGKVDGYELSTVVLTVVDGIMHGHMNMVGESYSITPDNGGYLIIRNDPSRARPFDEGPLVPPALSAATMETQTVTTLTDDGSVIDVLVLYTQEMYNTYGPSGNNTLNTKIQSYIDLANVAYTNSGISTSLRLAHSALYTAAGAAEGILINNALDYITTDALAIIGPLRDTYNADMVSLLRHYDGTSSSCGIAWIMQTVNNNFKSHAFSVVGVRPAAEQNPYYCDDASFAHELGHNMGCLHDRIYAGTTPGAYPYSYGYGGVTASFLDSLPTSNPCYGSVSNPCNLRTDHQFGTIMSYLNPTLTYFSTPSVSYLSVPIGISGGGDGSSNSTSSADNARTINNTRVTVANFRVSTTDTTPPPAPVSLAATPATWTNVNSFSINWTAPSDPSGIAGAYYKIGSPPTTDTDGIYTTSKPFSVTAAGGGQNIYVWLQDVAGNKSYLNRSLTAMYFDGTVPIGGSLTATPGNTQVSLGWSGFSDSGGSGLSGTYKVVRTTGGNPANCGSGTQVYLGSGTSTTDNTGLTNGTTYYYRACAFDNAGNLSAGVTAHATPILNITVTTSPLALQVTADSTTYTAPHTFTSWSTGSGHTIAVASPQSGVTGTQYVFSSWSDGGAMTHGITTPAVDTTYTASFITQYQLTTTVSPGGAGTVSPDCTSGCWYNFGTAAGLLAIPNSGRIFDSWGGDCSGANPSTAVSMIGVKSCTANFASCPGDTVKNIRSGSTYPNIGDPSTGAYAAAQNLDTIRLLATELTETLNLNRAVSVTLSGGWNCGFATQNSSSIIHGSLTIGKDSLAVFAEKLIIY